MNLTLGKKIGMGFGILIVIAMILGGIAVVNMNKVTGESEKLANEYVPEVDVGAKLRGAANRIMYDMRGYGFTENDTYFKAAQKELDALKAGMKEGRSLASEAVHLRQLSPNLDKIENAMAEYENAMQLTSSQAAELERYRNQLDEHAATYMKASVDFIEGQNKAFDQDLAERRKKVELAQDLVNLGTSTRVQNFKAQADNDMVLMAKAVERLDGVDGILDEMKRITRDAEDLRRMKAIAESADGYQKAMQGYMQAAQSGAATGDFRRQMDENAGNYVKNCDDFLNGQQEKLAIDMQERHEKITLSNDIIDLGNDTRIKAFKAQATRDPGLMEEAEKNFAKMDKKFEDLRNITRLAADIEKIDNVQQAAAGYGQAMDGFLKNWKGLQALGRTRDNLGNSVIGACRKLADAGLGQTQGIANEAMSALKSASGIMVGGLAVALIVGVLVAFFLTRSITAPVNRIISGMNEGSEQVASASNQVSSASQSLAEGASEQASSLEETSSSLEEMAAQTRQNADNAEQADGAVKDTAKMVESGVESMQRMNTAINEIKESSNETSKIIKTIDDIAFQTNLLALNAAVEAARAGEAGKGFAVVAEEVRNLAQRSAEAAQNTSQLIEKSQENAGNGVSVADEVAKQLESIQESSKKVTTLIGEISAASKEQAQGLDQVNTAVSEMDKVVQQNAADSEESASAAEELSSQASEMEKMVAELTDLVGGAGQGDGRTEGGSAKKIGSAAGLTSRLAHNKEKKSAGSDKQAKGAASKSGQKSDQVIPLDDKEFQDF